MRYAIFVRFFDICKLFIRNLNNAYSNKLFLSNKG